jgi:hypothetical protein
MAWMSDILHIAAFVVFTCGAVYCGYRWPGRRTRRWAASFLLLAAWATGNANVAFVSRGHHHEVFVAGTVLAVAGAALLAIDSYLRYFTTRRSSGDPVTHAGETP